MDPSSKERSHKKDKKSSKETRSQKSKESVEEHHSSSKEKREEEPQKFMPKKKNLQIEVIDHPEADVEQENLESGDGSYYEEEVEEETDPNQYSEQEPNHREGTDNDAKYSDSMEANPGQPVQSLQSFGNKSKKSDSNEDSHEKHKIKQNAKNADNGKPAISQSHLDSFVKKKADPLNKTQKLDEEVKKKIPQQVHEDSSGEEYEQDGEVDEEEEVQPKDQIDDELVLKQQREAEELLEDTNKQIEQEDENDEESVGEGEEDEVEDIAQLAKDNRIGEMPPPEDEEEEDEIENPIISKGK